MNKYSSLQGDIFSVFKSNAWIANSIPTFPSDFVGSVSGNYIRVSILASNDNIVNPPKSVSGQVIIEIFVKAGSGPSITATIADTLDTFLSGKHFTTTANGSTQFGTSTLDNGRNDKDNPSLYCTSYSIPFNFYGV